MYNWRRKVYSGPKFSDSTETQQLLQSLNIQCMANKKAEKPQRSFFDGVEPWGNAQSHDDISSKLEPINFISNSKYRNEILTNQNKPLSHLPLDKMAAISQMVFSNAFLLMKNCVFWLKFRWRLFLRVQMTTIQHSGLGNGLAPNRRQAIIWTNVDPIHRSIYAARGGDELIAGRVK